ncbi:hypothetical protein FSARC_12839 [Fusarium sarcochroum]|uniref:Cyanovirin-N domain-containing protein n=1 Tax=Fusarium sarcochroum TaxID=1208366 RepID=A0A8H4T5I7_9HYPO|nr:hypothetical protein FSARC_12839 [Fusarium sarcochroum]
MAKVAVLMALIGSTLAQFSKTCVDISFNPDTNVLSGSCQPRDNSGHVPTDLDLNNCFGYNGTILTATRNGNFGDSCSNCDFYTAPDPWYRTEVYWISCTCEGQSDKVAINLEVAVAHEYVSNKDGHLLC